MMNWVRLQLTEDEADALLIILKKAIVDDDIIESNIETTIYQNLLYAIETYVGENQ